MLRVSLLCDRTDFRRRPDNNYNAGVYLYICTWHIKYSNPESILLNPCLIRTDCVRKSRPEMSDNVSIKWQFRNTPGGCIPMGCPVRAQRYNIASLLYLGGRFHTQSISPLFITLLDLCNGILLIKCIYRSKDRAEGSFDSSDIKVFIDVFYSTSKILQRPLLRYQSCIIRLITYWVEVLKCST